MKAEDAIERIVEILTREVQPDEVLLFGSRAKGAAHKGSDIDLAIVGGRKLSHREKRKLCERIEDISGLYSVDIVFIEEVDEDFKELIRKTGKVIYEKDRSDTRH
jgi:predicted nucleotidyltransferase